MAKTFAQQTETQDDCVLIVDALNLGFRWKHQGRTDFREQYVATVKSLAQSYKCGRVIITADQGSSSYRLGLSDQYKSSRKEKYADQTEQEKQAFMDFFDEVEETLELLAEEFVVLRFPKVEADDIAAHLVKHKDKYDLNRIWLMSTDADWDLLVSDKVSRWAYTTRKEVTAANWYDHYEVTPEQFISYKCLMGDKGDDVAGIASVGPKRAAGLLKQYESALDIYDAIPIPGKYVYIKNINNSGETIPLNYELMDLLTYCDDAIGSSNCEEIERRMLVEHRL